MYSPVIFAFTIYPHIHCFPLLFIKIKKVVRFSSALLRQGQNATSAMAEGLLLVFVQIILSENIQKSKHAAGECLGTSSFKSFQLNDAQVDIIC